ncbi:MarR family winged helix-turn-helix transcriptional regulator [Litorivita sp. NS0012-18]|uniref:MarR family winged helix-turn-helix transcriptional regulator n=1 Tax=Litorivita sp. NS0012-18 TaxID=3127655 RepID=UPI00310BCF73
MTTQTPTESTQAAAMTRLILEVFRLNGALLAASDALVADIGLTSARWQVMGGIALKPDPRPVAWIADDMGLSRQAVQRIVNDLQKAGLVELRPNPHHARAKLVALTETGAQVLDQAAQRQVIWAEALVQGLAEGQITAAADLTAAIADRLQGS